MLRDGRRVFRTALCRNMPGAQSIPEFFRDGADESGLPTFGGRDVCGKAGPGIFSETGLSRNRDSGKGRSPVRRTRKRQPDGNGLRLRPFSARPSLGRTAETRKPRGRGRHGPFFRRAGRRKRESPRALCRTMQRRFCTECCRRGFAQKRAQKREVPAYGFAFSTKRVISEGMPRRQEKPFHRPVPGLT